MGLHHVASFSSIGAPLGAVGDVGVEESGAGGGVFFSSGGLDWVIDGAGGLPALQDGENFKVG